MRSSLTNGGSSGGWLITAWVVGSVVYNIWTLILRVHVCVHVHVLAMFNYCSSLGVGR